MRTCALQCMLSACCGRGASEKWHPHTAAELICVHCAEDRPVRAKAHAEFRHIIVTGLSSSEHDICINHRIDRRHIRYTCDVHDRSSLVPLAERRFHTPFQHTRASGGPEMRVCVSQQQQQLGARPTSLGGGRARLSADTGDPTPKGGGGESLQVGQARDGSRACIHRWCGIAAAAPAPAVDSGSDRRVCRASERGGTGRGGGAVSARPSGGRGPAGPKVGALQPPIGCPPARPPPERLLSF